MQDTLKKHRSDYKRCCDGKATQKGITCQSELLIPRPYDSTVPDDTKINRCGGEDNINNDLILEPKISKVVTVISPDKRFPSIDFTKFILEPVLNSSGHGDTNSKINIKKSILHTMSQQLQTDESSMWSLESNIQFFKVTVQEILDNFFSSMRDFEHYKNRFHEILEKSHNDSLAEMEAFIIDIIQHITSCEVCEDSIEKLTESLTKASTKDISKTVSKAAECNVENDHEEVSYFGSTTITHSEAFHLVCDDNSSLRSHRYRSHSSQIQLPVNFETEDKKVVSAENFVRIMSKKQELDKYLQDSNHNRILDRDIPVKVSSARKDIQINTPDESESPIPYDTIATKKSFMSRICGYLCRAFRR